MENNIIDLTDDNNDFNQYIEIPKTIRAKQIDIEFKVKTMTGTSYGSPGDFLVKLGDGRIKIFAKKYFQDNYAKLLRNIE